jgi:hypothetical protein
MGARIAAALLLLAVFTAPAIARCDDAGTVRADARVLLAHRVRLLGVDPRTLVIAGVNLAGDGAVVAWSAGNQHGTLHLTRQGERWWANLDEDDALVANPKIPVSAAGGVVHPERSQTGGYDVTLRYARNNAAPAAVLSQVYARPPTQAEFLPYPTPYRFVPDAVMFFDIMIEAPKPVSFDRGTVLDVWFPFVLDDKLKYSMSFSGDREPIGPVSGSVFDNVVHFELPGFTALPAQTIMGEIDGDLH